MIDIIDRLDDGDMFVDAIDDAISEISRLRLENEQLRAENEKLKQANEELPY